MAFRSLLTTAAAAALLPTRQWRKKSKQSFSKGVIPLASNKGLGKGLGALLGDFSDEPVYEKSAYQMLPIYKVEPNRDQPRQDFDEEELQNLADSISVHGVIQPLTVRELPSGYYQIIAGERRWRAARLANLSEVPAVIIEADDRKTMELALIENLQRQDLNPVEEALGYQSLMADYGLTQEDASQRVGKSRSAVANALRLLNLPDSILTKVREGMLSAGHARAILSIKSEKKQLEAAQKIIALGLSVRQAELLCKNMGKEPEPIQEVTLAVDYVAECEKQLSKHLGRGVKIINGKRKGRFELEFYGQDDLQNLLDALMKLQK
jgi:ParB family chromosome partitioning protein